MFPIADLSLLLAGLELSFLLDAFASFPVLGALEVADGLVRVGVVRGWSCNCLVPHPGIEFGVSGTPTSSALCPS